MSTESLANVKANLSQYVDQVEHEHERVTITRNGRPAAVLVSLDDLAALEETVSVLSDSDAMRDLADAEGAWARGEYTTEMDMDQILSERARREGAA
jgi:prevent-host-death family protein